MRCNCAWGMVVRKCWAVKRSTRSNVKCEYKRPIASEYLLCVLAWWGLLGWIGLGRRSWVGYEEVLSQAGRGEISVVRRNTTYVNP